MSRDVVYNVYPQTLALPAGVTVMLEPLAGQNCLSIKWRSGGSLIIIGSTTMDHGVSYMISRQYLLGSAEVMNMQLSSDLYLLAVGATCVCDVIRGQTSGYET